MKKTNHLICLILTLILLIGTVVPVSASSPEQSDVLSGVSVIPTGDGDTADDAPGTFMYQHDPTKSPAAMKDIVRDESAIYGFRPNESGSLKQYAEADWSDPEIVAQGREERIAYHNSIESMYETLSQMLEEGKSAEEIARTLSKMRNDIRIAAYENDPEGLERMKERNLEKYGHEEGPLPDELYEQYGLDKDKKTVLYLGRVDPEKNVQAVIEAFSKAGVENAQLIVVGDGVDKARLEKLVQEKKIKNVRFLGRVTPPDLYEVYKLGDIFATVSEIETQGIVLIEAAATGLPLIAVDAGAVSEVCRDGENGFLCQPGDTEAIAGAMRKLLENDDLRVKFSKKSLEIAKEHDFERTLDKFENIYQKVMLRY